MTMTKQVSWGGAIVVAVFQTAGGLKRIVAAINAVVGPSIGTRNTFKKLLIVTDPSTLGEKDLLRAWLLLIALGERPIDWGISDDVLPPVWNKEHTIAAIDAAMAKWAPSGSNRRPTD